MSNLPPNPWRFLRVRWVSLIFAVLAALGLSAVGSARADTLTPPTAGYVYGIAPAALPDHSVTDVTSGWDIRTFAGFGTLTEPNGRPVTFTLAEPYGYGGETHVPILMTSYGTIAGTNYTDMVVQGGVDSPLVGHAGSVVTCASSQWSAPGSQFTVASAGIFNDVNYGGSVRELYFSRYNDWPGINSYACPFLVSIKAEVAVVTARQVGVWTWRTATWSALDYGSAKTYTGVTAIVAHCASFLPDDRAARVECNGVTVPPDGLHSNPNTWCNAAPVPIWPSLDFGRFVTYFAECLFVPRNGLDSEGMVVAALSATGIPAFVDTVSAIPAGIMVTGTCGSLFDAPSAGYFTNFSINTCSWSWASPFRGLVGIGLQAGFAFFVIRWAFEGVNGMIGSDWRAPIWDGEKK